MMLAEIFQKDLRGHDYIAARGLTPAAVREQCQECQSCRRAAQLDSVARLLANLTAIPQELS